jgi:alpha-galactosidase
MLWQVDPSGISLWADIRSGGNLVQLGARTLKVATVVSTNGSHTTSAIDAAIDFCQSMCPSPRLPEGAIYGANDWNYAYGKNTAEGILWEADLVASVTPRGDQKPVIVIDDGWQDKKRFPDMSKLAASISQRGLVPGIWIRPAAATAAARPSTLLPAARFGADGEHPLSFDPTTPEGLAAIQRSASRAREWGFSFLKLDFTTYDLFGKWGFEMGSSPTRAGWSFADYSHTNAEILLSLYRAIREAAGEDTVLLGCNTSGHLCRCV